MRSPLAFVETPLADGPDLTRYLLVCLLLVGAVLVLAWLFRRFLAGELRRRAGQRSLQVLDVLPLGGRQKLVVVRCYDRNFLLGLGDKEVRSIAELDPRAAAPVEEHDTPVPEPAVEFAAALQKELPAAPAIAPPTERPKSSVLQEGLLG